MKFTPKILDMLIVAFFIVPLAALCFYPKNSLQEWVITIICDSGLVLVVFLKIKQQTKNKN